MADDLEARLQSHAKAFEGLMSLLPPDLYYGKPDRENEWSKKKQTKEQKKAARRAKLDPANHKTAKDVADERDRKRRLEDEEAERSAVGVDGPLEQPMEGIKQPKTKTQKTAKDQDVHSKSKADTANPTKSTTKQQVEAPSKEEKQKEKEQRRKEKQARKAAKDAARKAKKQEKLQPKAPVLDKDAEESENEADDQQYELGGAQLGTDMDAVDMSGLLEETAEDDQASSRHSASPTPEFSPYHNGTVSSTSSLETPADAEESSRPKLKSKPAKQIQTAGPPKLAPTATHETPQEIKARKQLQMERIQAIIDEKRKARNADGLNGKPARSRTELIEARRQKEQQRKEKKKELRAQEREQLKKAEAEAHLASLRGSPALGAELFAPRSRSGSVSSPRHENNTFSFGRVAFADGSRMNSSLSGLAEPRKQKGPADAKTALLLAEKHAARINGLDEAKRTDIEEKDMWLKARKRINGEKVKDDVNLLKKSLKRKEKLKSRSESQWGERIEGVQKSQAARQKKREDNIAKRREEKGGGGKKGKKTGAGVKKAPKRRAGFEGTFRGRA